MKKTYKYIIPVGLGLGLIYWVFKDLDFLATLQSFKNANYFLVFLSMLAALSAHISRAYRFKLIVEPMGYYPSLLNSTVSILIGYITNLVLPRAGELARPASMVKSENIPFEKSFGVIIVERIIDILMLGVFVIINLILEFDRIKSIFIEIVGDKFKNPLSIVWLLAFIVGFVFLIFIIFKKYKDKFYKNKFFEKGMIFIKGVLNGLTSVFKIQKPFQFIFHTFLIWFLYYLSTYLLCKATMLGQNMEYLTVLTVFVMGSIGMAAPTMGGIGSYHFLVGKIVVLYGLTNQEGIGLATFLHTMQGLVFVILLGAMAFLINVFSSKKTV